MFYMVNPSKLPKRNRRRNPELLIVNPYSLDEKEKRKKANMAKKRKKARRSRSRKRSRRKKYRRNPDFKMLAGQVLGENYANVKTAALMAVGGGLALGIATAALSSRVDTASNLGKGVIALAAGLGGGIAAAWVGETLGAESGIGRFLTAAAIPGAMGAMVLGFWTIAQPHVEPIADKMSAKLGFAEWQPEYESLEGYSPYGAFVDEFAQAKTMDGFGQPVVVDPTTQEIQFIEKEAGTSGYEPLGDIYNEQRLGSFEAEPGLGSFQPEVSNLINQQDYEATAAQAGTVASYFQGYDGNDPFEPFISD
jgi:hypothetical protein